MLQSTATEQYLEKLKELLITISKLLINFLRDAFISAGHILRA